MSSPPLSARVLRLPGLLASLAACAALLSGCHYQALAQAADEQASQQTADVHADARNAVVWVRCPDPAHPLGPSCGLLSEGLRGDEFMGKFARAYCQGQPDDECQRRHERFYAARLRDRYFAADTESVAHQCDLEPGSCDDAVVYEKLLMRSHNARIHDRANQDVIAIEHDRVATREYVLHQGRRCVSRTLSSGSETLTTCDHPRWPWDARAKPSE